MPVNESLMSSLKKQYGPEKGERIYYAMEQKAKKKGIVHKAMGSKK